MSPGHRKAEEPRHATYPDSAGARTGSRAPSIPRCGVSSPFRGHLSTKSNAFCIGHSSRLSDQYRIRDNMLIHYNKILSAKAAVDCSVPRSLTKSIKYSDQQRREKMKKEVTRLEKTTSHSAASSRPRSRDRTDSAAHRKDPYGPHSPLLRCSPYSDPGPVYSPSSFISSPRRLRSPAHTGEMYRRPPDLSSSYTSAFSGPGKFQDNQVKTYSGDLLEKHSHHFTSKERPFTPRTLKTQAKSALAQSRHYTPPRWKRRATVAETQTDISSFRCRSRSPERESSPIRDEEWNQEYLHLSDEDDEGPADQDQPLISRFSSSDFKSSSPALQRIRSEEEELAYLRFVTDVTNEILTLGLYSDRAIGRVFQRHVEENRHRLDERKMRHLLDTLRADLDHKGESNMKSPVSSPWVVSMNGSADRKETASYRDGLVSDRKETASYLDGLVSDRKETASYLDGLVSDRKETASYRDGLVSDRKETASYLDGLVSDRKETASYLDGLVSDRHLHMDSPPYKDTKHQPRGDVLTEAGIRDCAPGDDAHTDEEDGGYTSPRQSPDHDLSVVDGRGPEGDRGSPDHGDDDYLLAMKVTPEDASAEDRTSDDASAEDHTSDDACSSAGDLSQKNDDLVALEDLRRSFSDVVRVSRDEGTEETEDQDDF